ncbi:MAG TPA: dihydropteroate synthase [Ghiorsea sp.]|nr:dihydropteroate synthase [Ghiorsea sp.]HIP06870.1 dihydropteroate synthase [Mariprofundaceae bacterium]
MGVLNCTPDSFSDGNIDNLEAHILRAKEMIAQGADMIDVGGESTRPNAMPVSLEEELSRVLPVVKALTALSIPVSIDTMKAEVMLQATQAGATLVNDVSALTHDEKSLQVVAKTGADVCLMHMKGNPQTMQDNPIYDDVLTEVMCFFEQRIEACLSAGIAKSAIVLDPGIGFGKRLEDNLRLIVNVATIKDAFHMPVLLGASRKSFLGLITGSKVRQRETETAVASAIGIFCGADMIRVHDCSTHHQTTLVASQLLDAKQHVNEVCHAV